jgi:hypothetical protein
MNLLFRAIVGSQAYGTSTPTSDTDFKGIFSSDLKSLIGFGYKEQIEIGKDETIYELRRFLQLIQSANPTVLELLYSPEDCIVHTSPAYELLKKNRDKFLTVQCANSFGGYAIAQIKKARGLDKKMNYEKSRVERKTPLDFCYVYDEQRGSTEPLTAWFKRNSHMKQEHCGLVRLNHIRDCYALHYDWGATYENARGKMTANGFKGIVGEDSNELRLSSVPKESSPETLLYYNKDGYSVHCKDYREYQTWLENRNTQRYVDTVTHGQQIDGKNLMHCRRLLEMAVEIPTEGTIKVRRPNASELLKIRRGEVSLEELLDKSEQDIKNLDQLFASSGLPKEVDAEWVNELLLEIREMYDMV